jgi:nucleotide-binding universal stress UspA family protein
MFKTVLFPVDQSRASLEAAETVIHVVEKYASRLIVLSVLEHPPEDATTPMADHESIAQLLQNVKNLFSQKGITAEVIEREGVPAFTICDVADEVEADLIIMGCRGLGLTEESESVTSKVINLSPCAVLVVP